MTLLISRQNSFKLERKTQKDVFQTKVKVKVKLERKRERENDGKQSQKKYPTKDIEGSSLHWLFI